MAAIPRRQCPCCPRVPTSKGRKWALSWSADTEDIAEEALRLIDVEWDVRPFVLHTEDALKPGAPLANPENYPDSNHYNEGFVDVTRRGDVAKGFAEADVIVEFRSERLHNTWIGPERPCGVFRWNGEYPELWVKQQRPHISKRVVIFLVRRHPHEPDPGALPLPGRELRRMEPDALEHGRPLLRGPHRAPDGKTGQMAGFRRREDFYGGQMDEGVYYGKVGAKKDGTMTAVEARVLLANTLFPLFGVVQHI